VWSTLGQLSAALRLAVGLHHFFIVMAEIFEEFSHVLVDENGVRYQAHACGSEMPDGKWQGWLEFVPLDGAAAIRSGRETTQPNRNAMMYWATGLTPVYLEGALQRALKQVVVRTPMRDEPAFEGPAPTVHTEGKLNPEHDAVLDPFSVYEKGEALLRSQLLALSPWHLVNIIEGYGLSDESPVVLNRLPAAALIEAIVSAVATERTHTVRSTLGN
jgi:hypothetical protein